MENSVRTLYRAYGQVPKIVGLKQFFSPDARDIASIDASIESMDIDHIHSFQEGEKYTR